MVLLATTLCDAPISLVSLVDRERQWFKACICLDVKETHRDLAFCANAILQPSDVLVGEDATT
ncbi:histidine kinase, partial [Pseudomonas syringae pv. tagetis]